MPTQGFLVAELSRIISQATAPAFLLAAMAAFISVLIGRLNRIVDRDIDLAVAKNGAPIAHLTANIPSLKRRVKLLCRALEYAVVAAIFITLLVIVAFAGAAIGLHEVYGAALMFVLALSFFSASLICLWLEIRIAVQDLARIT
jgi:hypothetical protein